MSDDQAMLHYLYLNQSRLNLGATVQMDVRSSFFLSTWTCRDRVWPRVHTVFGPFERCHVMKHDPGSRVLLPASGSASALRFNASDGSEQQPFMLHANGKDKFLSSARVRTDPRLKHLADTLEHMRQPPVALMGHRVLLLDSPGAACRSTTLGEFLRKGQEQPTRRNHAKSRPISAKAAPAA